MNVIYILVFNCHSSEKNAEKDSQLNEAHSELDKLQLELQRVTSELHSKTNQITQLQLELDIQKVRKSKVFTLIPFYDALQVE